MLSVVICLLHFFSMHYFVRRGRLGALLRRSSTQYAAFGLLKRSCSPVWFDARLDWWLVWPFSGLARAPAYCTTYFLLHSLPFPSLSTTQCRPRLLRLCAQPGWFGLAASFSLQPRRVKRELLSLACKKAAVAPTAAVAAPPAFFFFWRETLYIPSH